MGDKDLKLAEDMAKLKEIVKAEVTSAWKKGYAEGVVSACGVLYETISRSQILADDHVVVLMIKQLATSHGCADLDEYIANINAALSKKTPNA